MNNIANISINPNKKLHKLNNGMYGIFYEEINHSGDGGLYPELVSNRNFMSCRIPEGTSYYNGYFSTKTKFREEFKLDDLLPSWKLLKEKSEDAIIQPWLANPRSKQVPNQLKLTVNDNFEKVLLINEGYWKMAGDKGDYTVTIIARSNNINSIDVSLIDENNNSISKTSISGIDSKFKKFKSIISVQDDFASCQLAINAKSCGEIFFDYISLYPKNTFRGRENGFNIKIATMLEEMKPGFVRFPGGCIVEGISFENAYNFKKTIGPVEDRPGSWNLWGYRRTDGFGYHEFLQFCEDIGAKPMYVFNCGITCQGRREQFAPYDEWDSYLQDALDAIQYAIGDASTKWGRVRAENGHPEPFSMEYIEIGNEQWGDKYLDRYNYFYSVLKKEYPDLKYILNEEIIPVTKEAIACDLIDKHYYVTAETFPQKYNEFDKMDRNGPKIYVGEYAVNHDVGKGNLAAAASEASFMINMERNCDIVDIASYAPLLCNENDRKWPVNLICFKDNKVYGIPSYYVQKLFSNNMADYTVETKSETISFSDEARVHCIAGICENNELIIKMVNFSQFETELKLKIDDTYETSKIYSICSDHPTDENSVDNPQNVTIAESVNEVSENLKPYEIRLVKMIKSKV